MSQRSRNYSVQGHPRSLSCYQAACLLLCSAPGMWWLRWVVSFTVPRSCPLYPGQVEWRVAPGRAPEQEGPWVRANLHSRRSRALALMLSLEG